MAACGRPGAAGRGQPRVRLYDLISRLAEDVLRHDIGPGASREEDGVGHGLARQLGDDVDRAVADPHDEHALSMEIQGGTRVDILVGVDLGPVEGSGEVGVARVPMVAITDEQRIEVLLAAVAERDAPPSPGPALGSLDARVETDTVAQRERVGVIAKPLEDMRVVRIVRIAIRHRKIAEGDRRLGYVDVQRAVGRGDAIRVLEVPVSPNLIGCLETAVGNTEVSERLAGGEPAYAGSDHAHPWQTARAGTAVGRIAHLIYPASIPGPTCCGGPSGPSSASALPVRPSSWGGPAAASPAPLRFPAR